VLQHHGVIRYVWVLIDISVSGTAQIEAVAEASWRGPNRGATIGSSPGPSFAVTGCIGFQPAQLTGENKPGLGGNEKPQLISRFASRLHRFLS
jgi:hypothetical protein